MKPLHVAFTCLLTLTCPVWAHAAEGAAGPDQSICGTAAMLAAYPLAMGESGSWSVLSGSAVFADNASPVSLVTGLSSGDNVLQWTLLGNGIPEIDQLIITVHDPAATAAFAGADSVLCLPVDTMHLFATPATMPAIGSWSSVGIALIDVFTDPHSGVEFPSGGTVQMIWTVFNGTCGQVSDTVAITVEECVIGVAEQVFRENGMLSFDFASRMLALKNVPAGAHLDVIDQTGRTAMTVAVNASVDSRVPLTGLRPGSYVLRLMAVGLSETLRIFIDR